MGWLDKSIEGTMVRAWVKPDPKNQGRAVCLVCPLDHQQNPSTFSIAEGFDSITQHSKTKSHREHMTASQTDPDFQWPVPAHQKSMREGLEDMEKARQAATKTKEKLLVAQVRLVMAWWNHGCSGRLFDCGARLFPLTFPCETTKAWNLRYLVLTIGLL